MYVMNTNEAVKLLNSGSKALSWHVVTELKIKPRKIVEEGLDWSADIKAINYLTAYRAQFGKYPKVIRFDYRDGDVRIIGKSGNIIL